MTALATHLAAFLREHLPHERKASPHTCATYAYSFQLLVCFAARQLKVKPCQLDIEQIDAPLVLAFLKHIEIERHNSARTRNVRLAGVNSFFRFLEYRLPSCLDQARRIHAIPMKKADEPLIGYLTHEEMQALLNAPDPRTKFGIRDKAMLYLAFATGLRVSELISLRLDHLDGQACSSINVMGKGRRERVLPLWKETATALRAWLAIRPRNGCPELFPNAVGRAMTRSGFGHILAKHVAAAAQVQPSIIKKRVSPHVLRHTCAMHTLQATRDVRKVSLWLGHASLQSTEIYLRADPTEKLEALGAMAPVTLQRGRFHAPDKLLAMLRAIGGSKNYAK
jgi:integrase/recombinase XerD